MSEILTLTNNAIVQLKKIVSNNNNNETNAIRLGIDKSGCNGYSYKIDFAKNEEIINYDTIEKGGLKLYIDPKATMFLFGSEMDYLTDKISSRFVFKNPNEKSTCGCGESFSI